MVLHKLCGGHGRGGGYWLEEGTRQRAALTARCCDCSGHVASCIPCQHESRTLPPARVVGASRRDSLGGAIVVAEGYGLRLRTSDEDC